MKTRERVHPPLVVARLEAALVLVGESLAEMEHLTDQLVYWDSVGGALSIRRGYASWILKSYRAVGRELEAYLFAVTEREREEHRLRDRDRDRVTRPLEPSGE